MIPVDVVMAPGPLPPVRPDEPGRNRGFPLPARPPLLPAGRSLRPALSGVAPIIGGRHAAVTPAASVAMVRRPFPFPLRLRERKNGGRRRQGLWRKMATKAPRLAFPWVTIDLSENAPSPGPCKLTRSKDMGSVKS